jgi:hypothetical protein
VGGGGGAAPPPPPPPPPHAGERYRTQEKRRRHIAYARPLLALALATWVSTAANRAQAHAFDPALLLLKEQRPDVFAMTWRPPVGAEAARTGQELAPRLPAHCRPLDDAAPTPAAPLEPRAPTMLDCRPHGLRGTTISVVGLETSPADAIVQISWLGGARTTVTLHRGAPEFVVPGVAATGPLGTAAVAAPLLERYVRLGTQTILLGVGPLVFVLGLLLLVADLQALPKTLAAFMLAHSVTLGLATLGALHVPPAAVEGSMALGILLIAVEVARAETGYTPELTLARQFPWVVAFAFGLPSGLWFAGTLLATDPPSGHVALRLVAFNIGVEAGQLLLVAALLVPALAWRRLRLVWPRIRLIPTYAMGSAAVAWALAHLSQLWS